MQQLYKVWKGQSNSGVGVGERCLLTVDGDFVGAHTGMFFSKKEHYSSKDYKAVVISVDQENKTGMIHLSEDTDMFGINKKKWKERYIGCCITVSEAHKFGETVVYYCEELNDYFSEFELSVDKTELVII